MILANQMKTPRTGLSIILLKNMSFNYMISYLILLFPSLVKALKTFKCMSNKWRRQIIATFFQQLLISYKGSSENRSKLNMKNNLWWPKFHLFKGQLIRKVNFSVFNSPKNRTWKCFFLPWPTGAEIIHLFFGRIGKSKKPFGN